MFNENFEQMPQQPVEPEKPATERTFDAKKELQEVRHAPREERAQKLAEFKETLALQKEGLGETQEELIKIIREKPDTPFPQLYEAALKLGSRFGMNEEQKEIAKDVLQAYAEKHAKIQEVRDQYPDDPKLYEVFFGEKPHGKVEVVEGPMTLYFRCHDVDDYIRIHEQHFLLKNNKMDSLDKKIAETSLGLSINTSRIPGLDGVLIAENSSRLGNVDEPTFTFRKGLDERDMILTPEWRQKELKMEKDQKSQGVQDHEEQHVIRGLFKTKIVEHYTKERFENAETDTEKILAIKSFWRDQRQNAEERASNEIMAFFKMNNPIENTLERLTRPIEKNGCYDLCSNIMKDQKEWINKHYGKDTKANDLLNKTAENVFITEYHQLLRNGAEALQQLEDNGYSKDKAIGVLIHEPLSNWQKTVGRLLENKNKRA